MSIRELLDTGVCPPSWTRVRAHRLHSCTDVQFDRDLIGLIRLNGNIPPGPNRTFLHTDNAGLIAWKTFDQTDIPAGADGDYLQTIAGLVQWAPPTFAPSAIAPGTARQLLQTNTAATAAEWTSNVDVPGTLDVTGATTLDSSLNIVGNLSLNGASGTSGQYLKKTGAATQAWSDLDPADITPGTAFQTLQTNSLGTAPVWVDSIFAPGTISATGTLSSVNGGLTLSNVAAQINMAGASTQINCGGITTTQTLNTVGDMRFNGVSGTSGQILKKTGAATQAFSDLAATDIKGGTLNQVLQSNGTTGVFNTNVTLPGTLTVAGVTNVQANLQMNAVSGVAGNYLKKTSTTAQTWANIAAADITAGTNGQILATVGGITTWSNISSLNAFMRFYNNTPFNINTGTNVFATNGVQQVNVGSPFTFNVGTGTFTCAIAGTYTWNFSTILSTHDAQSKLLITDGTTYYSAQQIDYVAGLTTAQPFSFTGTFAATIGQNWAVGFASFGVGGVCNISGADPTFLCPTTTLEIIRL